MPVLFLLVEKLFLCTPVYNCFIWLTKMGAAVKRKRGGFRKYSVHYIPNFRLAFPVVLSQAGQMVVALADTLMVGRLGATQLAAASLANSIFVVGLVFGIGIVSGITPLAGKEFGGGNRQAAAGWLKNGLAVFPALAIIQALLLAIVVLILPYLGQPPQVVQLAIPYYLVLVASLIPFQIFVVFKQYAEGLGNTRIAMMITILANVVNIALNYILIYGKLGLPAYGLLGAGYATLISRFLMPLAFVVFFFSFRYFKADRVAWKMNVVGVQSAIKLLSFGVPIAGQYVAEVLAFSLGSIMMGWLGAKALAAHQIVLSLASFTYMVSSGFAAATTIKVSHFRGQNRPGLARSSVFASLHQVLLFMGFSVTVFCLFRFKIPGLFVPDQEVIAIAGFLMLIAGMFQLFDGLQVVMLGALRGYEDVKIPMLVVLISYFVIALPVSYFFAFTVNLGPAGIWVGYLVGLMSVGITLLSRFRKLSRREL